MNLLTHENANLPRLAYFPHDTRESWLSALVRELHEHIFSNPENNHGRVFEKLPKHRIACSFPGGGSARARIGECWDPVASADGTTEMIVSPVQDDVMGVVETVAHEMCHMYLGCAVGHRAPFKRLIIAIGNEYHGKGYTSVGERFAATVQPILAKLGPYPHAKINLRNKKKQTTRMIKAECDTCGFVFRTTGKWLEQAPELRCPDVNCDGTAHAG